MMKKMFEDNINIVYKVYHDKIEHRTNAEHMKDDLIQIGILTLWKCCMSYDPGRGVEFSTYAYSSIYRNMTCALVRENKKTAYLIHLSDPIKDNSEITYEDVVASPVSITSQIEIDDIVNQITDALGEKTEKIVEMLRKGYSQVDIAKELNVTRSYVSKILKKFRKKLKDTLFLED